MKVDVLNHGFVEFVDKVGSDAQILAAARTSTGSAPSKGDKKDRGLIRYLYRNQHMSPFEFCTLQFHVKAPLFVIQQILRHRAFSINQSSSRYREMEDDMWFPNHFRVQDEENKQNSNGSLDDSLENQLSLGLDEAYENSYGIYKGMIDLGIAREQARAVLPTSLYSNLYISTNLRNLFHFLELRLSPHAQYEIRVYAEAILKIINELDDIKWSVEIFKEMYDLDILYQKLLNQHKSDLGVLKEKLFRLLNQEKYE